MEEDLIARLRVTGAAGFRSSLRGATGSVTGLGRSVGSAIPGVKTLMGLGAGFILADKLRDAASAGFGFNRMIDSQRVAFTTLLGSQREAAQFMGQIRRMALESPVLDPETTGNSARLLMAYGLAAKDVLPMVKALGDMSAATGKSIQEVMPRGAMALGQIASKGKLQSEELNQLAESVGLSRVKIARELGMTRDEFASTFTPGNNIDAAKALPAIMAAMERQSGGAAKRLSKTTAGRMDRLREVIKMKLGGMTRPIWRLAGHFAGGLADRLANFDPKRLKRRIDVVRKGFTAGLSKGAGPETAGFAGASGVAVKVGAAFRKVGPVLGRALRGVGPLLSKIAKGALAAGKQLVGAFAPAMPFIKNVLGPLLLGFGKGVIMGVVAVFKLAVPVIRVFAKALGWIGSKLKPLRGVFEAVGTVLGFVFGPSVIGAAAKAIGVTAAAASGPLATAIRLVWRGLKPLGAAFKWVGGVLARVLGPSVHAFITAGRYVWLTVLPKIRRGFQVAFGGLGAFVSGVFGSVVRFIENRVNNIIDAINFVIRATNKVKPGRDIGEVGHIGARGRADARRELAAANDPRSAAAPLTGRGKVLGGFGARPGPLAPPRATGSALFRLEVPVQVGRRELGRASATIAAGDLARK